VTRLLAIDDEEEILAHVKSVAEGLGITTQTLSDTLRFMTTFVRFKPDIIALDLVMPDLDGVEIIRWLTDVDYSGRLIIISGYSDYRRMGVAMADARQRMVVSSLPKPFRLSELRAVLSHTPMLVEQ
jgi:DNA-binding response OmpR family regulator